MNGREAARQILGRGFALGYRWGEQLVVRLAGQWWGGDWCWGIGWKVSRQMVETGGGVIGELVRAVIRKLVVD